MLAKNCHYALCPNKWHHEISTNLYGSLWFGTNESSLLRRLFRPLHLCVPLLQSTTRITDFFVVGKMSVVLVRFAILVRGKWYRGHYKKESPLNFFGWGLKWGERCTNVFCQVWAIFKGEKTVQIRLFLRPLGRSREGQSSKKLSFSRV